MPDFEASPPARQGYLWKKSEHRKKWNKRWVVLWPATARPGDGRTLYWFAAPGDPKAKGMVKLVPGAFNAQTASGHSKKERNFPLTMVLEMPDRERVHLAADNEREVLAWVAAIQSRQCDANGTAVASPGFVPNLSSKAQRGFDQHSTPSGRASDMSESIRAAGGDAVTDAMREALRLLLPGIDLSASIDAKDLMIQAQHAAKAREEAIVSNDSAAAAERAVAAMRQKVEGSESAWQAQRQADEERFVTLQEECGDARGESRLLQAEISALQEQLRHGGQDSMAPPAETESHGAEEGVPDLAPQLQRQTERLAILETMLEESQDEAKSLRAQNRELRFGLDAQQDEGSLESARLLELQTENAALFSEVTEARAGLAQASAASEKAVAQAEGAQERSLAAEATAQDMSARMVERAETAEAALAVAAAANAEQLSKVGELEEMEMAVDELGAEVAELEQKLEQQTTARYDLSQPPAQLWVS